MEPQAIQAQTGFKIKAGAIGILITLTIVFLTIYFTSGGAEDTVTAAFGKSCKQIEDKSTCAKNLECIGDISGHPTCICAFGEDQIYNPEDQTCLGKVGSICHSTSPFCVPGAMCLDFRCECITGNFQNKERGCDAGYGKFCNPSLPCSGQVPGLICNHERCTCRNGLKYEETRTQCSITVGGICKRDGDCVTNAVCNGTAPNGMILSWGRCTCSKQTWGDGSCHY